MPLPPPPPFASFGLTVAVVKPVVVGTRRLVEITELPTVPSDVQKVVVT